LPRVLSFALPPSSFRLWIAAASALAAATIRIEIPGLRQGGAGASGKVIGDNGIKGE